MKVLQYLSNKKNELIDIILTRGYNVVNSIRK